MTTERRTRRLGHRARYISFAFGIVGKSCFFCFRFLVFLSVQMGWLGVKDGVHQFHPGRSAR